MKRNKPPSEPQVPTGVFTDPVTTISDTINTFGDDSWSFPPEDNIEAAMDVVAETLVPTRGPSTGTEPGEQTQRQVIIRATDRDANRWKEAAEHLGVSMAEFVRGVMNEKCIEVLDCNHPPEKRQIYPWSEFCLKCGQRVK